MHTAINSNIFWYILCQTISSYNGILSHTAASYVLYLSVIIQDKPELRKEALNQWNKIDQTLTNCLRENSKKAFDSGAITDEQKHRYYMSGM